MNAHSIAAQASDDMSLQVPDPLLVPALFQALFWKPRFMIDSPVTVHVPLFYWLSCVLRPQRVTILGANDGMAHFAFCQALDRLGSGGRCEAFGFWRDPKTGEGVAPPPSRLREHQEMLYDDLSKLIPCATLDEALDQMKPADTDLLLCNLSALPRGTQISGETLLACLSKPGILLLHGTNKAKQGQADIRGMSRFLDGRCYVEFSEGEGLTLICSGNDLPAPLQLLVDMAPGGLLRRDVEQVFRRSGQGLRAIAEGTAHTQARQLAEKSFIDTQEMLQKLQEELKSLQESHDLRSANLAKTQCEVFDLRRELEELASTVVVRTTERDAAKVDAELARQAQAETSALLATIQEEAAAARNGLETERKIRFEETEALTRISEELRNKLDTTEAALVERTTERDAAKVDAELARQAQAETSALLATIQEEAAAARNGLETERKIRFEETEALTRISEELRNKLDTTEAALVERTTERDAAKVDAEAARQAQAETSALLAAIQEEAAAARNGLETERKIRFEETAALTQISKELRNKLDTTEAELVERTGERDTARWEAEAAQRGQREAATAHGKAEASLTCAQANVEAAKAELQAERHTRFEETAALTQIAEDLHKKIEADAEAARDQLQVERQEKVNQYKMLNQIAEELRKKLREISKQKERLQRHNQELLDSTSWRITAPMRAVKKKLSLRSRRETK